MIEGILVRKTPFQDRHIIGDLILRNGKKQGAVFFGGAGGGKKVKPSNLEIGKLYQLQYHNPPKGDLLQTKEWRVQWSHENIRYDYTRFLLLSFICEISSTIAVPEQDLEDQSDNQFKGLFTVISNGIFYLENNKIDIGDMNFIIFFLGKLMIDVGIFPDTNKCLDCEKPIMKNQSCFLDTEKGGFSCSNCPITIESPVNATRVLHHLSLSSSTPWKMLSENISNSGTKNQCLYGDFKMLLDYFCFQLNINTDGLKTVKSFS